MESRRYYILKILRFLLPCEIVGDYYEPHWIYRAYDDATRNKKKK